MTPDLITLAKEKLAWDHESPAREFHKSTPFLCSSKCSHSFIEGAGWQHDHTKPITDALLKVAEAVSRSPHYHLCPAINIQAPGECTCHHDALAELEKAVRGE